MPNVIMAPITAFSNSEIHCKECGGLVIEKILREPDFPLPANVSVGFLATSVG